MLASRVMPSRRKRGGNVRLSAPSVDSKHKQEPTAMSDAPHPAGASQAASDDIEEQVPAADAIFVNALYRRHTDCVFPDMDQLDGYLTALVCSPRLLAFDTILTHTLSRSSKRNDFDFFDKSEIKTYLDILQRRLTSIHHLLSDSNRQYTPYIANVTMAGNLWSAGFCAGSLATGDVWDRIFDDVQCRFHINVIGALSAESHLEPEKLFLPRDTIEEYRDAMVAGLPSGVQKIFDYFAKERERNGESYPKLFSQMDIHVGEIGTEAANGMAPDTLKRGRGKSSGPKRKW